MFEEKPKLTKLLHQFFYLSTNFQRKFYKSRKKLWLLESCCCKYGGLEYHYSSSFISICFSQHTSIQLGSCQTIAFVQTCFFTHAGRRNSWNILEYSVLCLSLWASSLTLHSRHRDERAIKGSTFLFLSLWLGSL